MLPGKELTAGISGNSRDALLIYVICEVYMTYIPLIEAVDYKPTDISLKKRRLSRKTGSSLSAEHYLQISEDGVQSDTTEKMFVFIDEEVIGKSKGLA